MYTLDVHQYVHVLSVLGSRRQCSRCDLTAAEGKDQLSQPAGSVFLNTKGLTLIASWTLCWLMFDFLPPRTLPILECSFLSPWWVPRLFPVHRVISLWVKHVISFCWALLLQPVEVPLSGSTTTPYFLCSANSLRAPWVPLFMSLRKMAPIPTGVHN